MASRVSAARSAAPRHSRRRWLVAVAAAPVVALGLAFLAYSVATTPPRTAGRSPLTGFDPVVTGRLEQQAWASYYYRQWPQLFDQLLRLSRSQFGLSLPQALYASSVATRAQVVFARQGDAGGEAEADMRRFYEFVREPTGGRYDPARAAKLEVNWWVVHRHRDEYPDRSVLTRALAETYAEVYQAPVDRFIPAAEARAEAMDLSDQWNREGKQPDSPLLGRIADLLVTSYRELGAATAP